jgi:predicted Zn-dependent protease
VADEVRSQVQMSVGRNDDALKTLGELMRRLPKSKKVKVWALMRIDLYLRKGEAGEDDSVDAVCALLKLDPQSAEAWQRFWPPLDDAEGRQRNPDPLLEKVRRLGKWQRGIDIAAKMAGAIIGHETSEDWGRHKAQVHWAAYECYANLGKNAEAEKQIQLAIGLDKREATYPNSFGLLLRYMGRTDEAISQFENALKIMINLPWAWENLGATYLSLGKVREARAALTQGLAWAKDDETQWDPDYEGAQLQTAQFETWKIRRLLIEAWRLERAQK